MLRDVALRGADRLDDLLHRDFTAAEQTQNLQPERMRDRLHRPRRQLDIFRPADQLDDGAAVLTSQGLDSLDMATLMLALESKYKKVIRSTVRFHAHDEANTAGVGDKVRIVETRPLSKTKHWRLAEIVEVAK